MRKEIGIKETPERWIEVSTPQIVQPSLLIIHIPAIPEGLDRTQRAGKRTSLTEHLAPSIVRIRYHFGAVVVNQINMPSCGPLRIFCPILKSENIFPARDDALYLPV